MKQETHSIIYSHTRYRSSYNMNNWRFISNYIQLHNFQIHKRKKKISSVQSRFLDESSPSSNSIHYLNSPVQRPDRVSLAKNTGNNEKCCTVSRTNITFQEKKKRVEEAVQHTGTNCSKDSFVSVRLPRRRAGRDRLGSKLRPQSREGDFLERGKRTAD